MKIKVRTLVQLVQGGDFFEKFHDLNSEEPFAALDYWRDICQDFFERDVIYCYDVSLEYCGDAII